MAIYPPLENVPYRFAILRRNKWIVDNGNFIIFYVDFIWGGDYQLFEHAKKIRKDYVIFGDFNDGIQYDIQK